MLRFSIDHLDDLFIYYIWVYFLILPSRTVRHVLLDSTIVSIGKIQGLAPRELFHGVSGGIFSTKRSLLVYIGNSIGQIQGNIFP